MDFQDLYDVENEFQFQLYKDIRRERAASTHEVTPACDLNHMAAIPGPEKLRQRVLHRIGRREASLERGCQARAFNRLAENSPANCIWVLRRSSYRLRRGSRDFYTVANQPFGTPPSGWPGIRSYK